MKIDKKIIKELNEYLEEFNLTEIEITEKDTKIKVSKNIGSNINQPSTVGYNSLIEKSISEKNPFIGLQTISSRQFHYRPAEGGFKTSAIEEA